MRHISVSSWLFCMILAQVMSSPTFRCFTSKDVIGVEVGGAVKNVIALAAGMCEGLGLGKPHVSVFIGLHITAQPVILVFIPIRMDRPYRRSLYVCIYVCFGGKCSTVRWTWDLDSLPPHTLSPYALLPSKQARTPWRDW